MSDFEDAKLILTPNAYKAGKAYCVKPFDGSGDLTVVRNTTATARNSSGNLESVAVNVPRLNYPIGGGCPSWLIEGQSTNLVTYSNEFTNTSWSKQRLTVVGQKLIPNSVFNSHLIRKTLTTTTAGKQTMSIEAKADGYNFIRFWEDASTGKQCFFDLVNGTATNSNMDSVSIIPLSDGYYKCIATVTVGTPNPFGFRVNVTPDGTTLNFSGDGINGVLIRNAQLETGSIATSYIPTNGSTVTRNADVLTVAPPSGTTEIVETLEDITYYIGGNNLITYSEDFSDASWVKVSSTITANATTSPNGTLTADLFREDASTGAHLLRQVAAGYTFSIYAKSLGRQWLMLYSGVVNSNAYFDLINGVVGTTLSDVVSTNITEVGNGWFRCDVSWSTLANNARLYLSDNDGSFNYTGDGVSGVYLWGAQLEQGGLTDYQATRDIVVVPATYQLPSGEISKVIMK